MSHLACPQFAIGGIDHLVIQTVKSRAGYIGYQT